MITINISKNKQMKTSMLPNTLTQLNILHIIGGKNIPKNTHKLVSKQLVIDQQSVSQKDIFLKQFLLLAYYNLKV